MDACLASSRSKVKRVLEKWQEAPPDVFSSIPAAMWWGVCTLTTVGYGDVYPVTGIGKLAGALIALLGIGVFGLPAGILAAGFFEEVQRGRGGRVCPHCGKEIECRIRPYQGARSERVGLDQNAASQFEVE